MSAHRRHERRARRAVAAALLAVASAWLCAPSTASPRGAAEETGGPVKLRYIGHSCFLITTPEGVRLVVDPFTSEEWPGMRLPPLEADHVLVTHPHWDHAAYASVRGSPRVTSSAGIFAEKDFGVRGITGRHAEVGGAQIGYLNTVFVIRTGGIRICHLGDNGPPADSPALAEAIGKVDVLLIPIDSERRVLDYQQARAWIEALGPRLVIPMHYRAHGVTFDNVPGLGTPDEWLSGQPGYRRVPGDTLVLDASSTDPEAWPAVGAAAVRVLTLPGQRLGRETAGVAGRAVALEAKRQADVALSGGDTTTALGHLQQAVSLDPSDADALQKIGFLHLHARRPDLAADFLSRSARAAGMGDVKVASLSWLGAGMAFDLMGRREDARAAYQAVIGLGVNDENQVDQAKTYLESPYQED